MGYSPWGCKESDMTEQLRATHTVCICYQISLSVFIGIYYINYSRKKIQMKEKINQKFDKRGLYEG